MQQAAASEGLSLDALPFEQDRFAATEVNVSRGEIAQALVGAGLVVADIPQIEGQSARFRGYNSPEVQL